MPRLGNPKARNDLDDIARALRDRHGCHTAILYGSHAAGDATAASDYDVAGFSSSPRVERIAGKWRGSYLDVFIYPESRLDDPSPEMLHLRGGVVLFDKGGAGERLLERLDEMFALGPERLPESEAGARRRWAWKMLDRAVNQDAEGNFRRTWLLTALLEDYFHLRRLWYLGPKKSLAYLESHAPDVYSAFEAALVPGASAVTVATVVEAVAGPRADEVTQQEWMP